MGRRVEFSTLGSVPSCKRFPLPHDQSTNDSLRTGFMEQLEYSQDGRAVQGQATRAILKQLLLAGRLTWEAKVRKGPEQAWSPIAAAFPSEEFRQIVAAKSQPPPPRNFETRDFGTQIKIVCSVAGIIFGAWYGFKVGGFSESPIRAGLAVGIILVGLQTLARLPHD